MISDSFSFSDSDMASDSDDDTTAQMQTGTLPSSDMFSSGDAVRVFSHSNGCWFNDGLVLRVWQNGNIFVKYAFEKACLEKTISPAEAAAVLVRIQRSSTLLNEFGFSDSDDPASDDSDDNMDMYNEAKAPGATCDPTIHAKPRLATLPHPTPPHLHPTQPNQPTPPLQDEGVVVCL